MVTIKSGNRPNSDTVKAGYFPTCIDVATLGDILHFSVTKQRAFLTQLQRFKPTAVYAFQSDFSAALYSFLGTIENRLTYNKIAAEIERRKRLLTIPGAYTWWLSHIWQAEGCSGDYEELRRVAQIGKSNKPQVKAALDWFATREEWTLAAGFLWAFGQVEFDDADSHASLIRTAANEYPEMEELLKPMIEVLDQRKVAHAEKVNDLRQRTLAELILDFQAEVASLTASGSVLKEIRSIRDSCEGLLAVAEVLIAQKPDLNPLNKVLSEIAAIADEQWRLKGAGALVTELESAEVSVDAGAVSGFVSELSEDLSKLEQSNAKFRKLQEKNLGTRRPNHADIQALSAALIAFDEALEEAHRHVIDGFSQWAIEAELAQNAETETDTSEAPSVEIVDADKPGDGDDETVSPEPSTTSAEPTETLEGTQLEDVAAEKRAEDDNSTDEPQVEAEAAAIAAAPEAAHNTGEELDGLGQPEEGVRAESNTHAESNVQVDLNSKLGVLLRAGSFDKAYWVSWAAELEGHRLDVDKSVLGSIAAALSPKTGNTVHPALRGFLADMNEMDELSGSERLLSDVALIVASVLSGEYDRPQNQLFGLAGQKRESADRELDELTSFVIENVIRRSWFPEQKRVERDISPKLIAAQVKELASEAEQYLSSLPQARFSYQPARTALLELFSEDSALKQILQVAAQGQVTDKNIKLVRRLMGQVDPADIISNLKAHTSLHTNQLQGNARNQLRYKLDRAYDFGARWLSLAEKQSSSGGGANQVLDDKLRTLLVKARDSLGQPTLANGLINQAAHAAGLALGTLINILNGEMPSLTCDLDRTLLRKADLELDPDFHPIEGQAGALLSLEDYEEDPTDRVIEQCLARSEFPRAMYLAELLEEPESTQREIHDRKAARVEALRDASEQAVVDIEDAYLLGLLSDNVEETQGLSRTALLTGISDAQQILESAPLSDEVDVRDAAFLLEDVVQSVRAIRLERQRDLCKQIAEGLETLSSSPEGRQDLEYVQQEMERYLAADDSVALAELLERLTASVREQDRIVRVEKGVNASVSDFFGHYEFLEDLQRQDPQRLLKSIKNREDFGPLLFADHDASHLERAESAIKGWQSLNQLRTFGPNSGVLRSAVEGLLALIGLRTVDNEVVIDKTTSADLALLRLRNPSGTRSCPVPAFGSELNGNLDIFVLRTKRPFGQFVEEMKGHGGRKAGALVVHLHPLTKKERLAIRNLCIKESRTLAILDFPLLAYLCAAENPLKSFFEIVLPLVWHQPYLKSGENVAPEMFVGRAAQVHDLLSVDGSCIVFGGRQLGKSALLRHLASEYHSPERGLFIAYRDVDSLGNPPQKNDEMEREFWFRISQDLGHIGFLSEKEQAARSGQRVNRNNAPREVAKLIRDRLSEDESLRLIILLDEADKLLDLDAQVDFRLVRALRGEMAATDRRLKIVFTGLRSVQRFNDYKNQPFAQLGSGNAIVIEPLPPKDAQDLVQRPLDALGFQFEDTSLILRILSQANYHPGLVQIFCNKLLDNLYQRYDRERESQTISRQDVYRVERDQGFMDDIRDRFNLTLKLDDKYKVLTDALVMSNAATSKLRVSQFRELGVSWWPQVFEPMDLSAMRATLDEMTGLGVLLREVESGATVYRLRSPNLLRLLGSRSDIESELLSFMEKSSPTRINPQNFHRFEKAQSAFSPFTMEQGAQIAESETPFRVSLICGSGVLGIRSAAEEIRFLLEEVREYSSEMWSELKLAPAILATGAERLPNLLRDKLKPAKRDHLFCISHLSDLPADVLPSDLVQALIEGPGRVCHHNARGRVFLIVDEDSIWRVMNDTQLQRLISDELRVEEIYLKRWSDGAIAHALEQLSFKFRPLPGGQGLFERTKGVHNLVMGVLKTLQGVDETPDEEALDAILESGLEGILADSERLGLKVGNSALVTVARSIFGFAEQQAEDACVDWRTTVDLLVEDNPDLADDILSNGGRTFQRWIQAIGLAGPKDRDGFLSIAPFSKRLLS